MLNKNNYHDLVSATFASLEEGVSLAGLVIT